MLTGGGIMVLLGKLKCFIGYHKWTYNLKDVKYVDDPIPDSAICSRCGAKYKEDL